MGDFAVLGYHINLPTYILLICTLIIMWMKECKITITKVEKIHGVSTKDHKVIVKHTKIKIIPFYLEVFQ